jgi:hydroxymethylpyrimidine/phosphomethylpyrimidine kinase
VLAIGGLDPSGRAGILADVRAIGLSRAEPLAIASVLTAQGQSLFWVEPVGAKVIAAQIDALLELGRIRAIKLGVIPDRETLQAIASIAARLEVVLVVDPVVRTSRGQALSRLLPDDFLSLAGPRVVITPNALEASWLLKERQSVTTADQAELAARSLAAEGFGAVVVKGGHFRDGPTDVLAFGERVARIGGQKLARKPKHRGTGCRYASTFASHLALGDSMLVSARAARRLVERYLQT